MMESVMIKKLLTLLLAGSVCIVSPGCSRRAWYDGLKEQQRQECYKYESPRERQGCLDRANSTTYDQYRQERENSGHRSEEKMRDPESQR